MGFYILALLYIQSGFVFNIDTKMWNVVDSLIATMQKQKAVYQLEKEGMVEGKVVRAISAVLDSVANDSCEYVSIVASYRAIVEK